MVSFMLQPLNPQGNEGAILELIFTMFLLLAVISVGLSTKPHEKKIRLLWDTRFHSGENDDDVLLGSGAA